MIPSSGKRVIASNKWCVKRTLQNKMNIQTALQAVLDKQDLTRSEMRDVMRSIMSGVQLAQPINLNSPLLLLARRHYPNGWILSHYHVEQHKPH
jgi:hypothetical protein